MKKLEVKLGAPNTLKIRWPPRLNWVAALTTAPESVPVDVPLPPMLKLAPACGVGVFWFCMKLLLRPGKSDTASGALVQLAPLLRKTFPAAPAAVKPVPPLFVGKIP